MWYDIFPVPSEFNVGGVYMTPLLIAAILGMGCAFLTAMALNRYRLSRFVAAPSVVLLALTAIYTTLIATVVVPS